MDIDTMIELKGYARIQANNVESIDTDTLERLVISGATWLHARQVKPALTPVSKGEADLLPLIKGGECDECGVIISPRLTNCGYC